MSLLDNRSHIKQIDTHNFLSHLLDAPEQLVEGYRLGEHVTVPALYAQAKQVLLLASAETMPVAEAIIALMYDYTRVPCTLSIDYALPHWVSSDTLVIALDYSGTSEQVLTAFREAAARRARLLAISVGADLGREARRVRAAHIELTYGAPARAAFFFMLGCVAILLKKLDFIEFRDKMIAETSVLSRSLLDHIGPEMAEYRNSAKQLAEKMVGRRTIIVGSGPLVGVAKKWQLDLAATGKTVSVASILGEFNDTIINGLEYQTKVAEAPIVIMLQSKYDHPRNKLQQALTYQVAQAHKFLYEQIFMHPSGSLLGEIVLSSLYGQMVSYYVALLANRDPSVLEASRYIREHLQQQETA